MSKPSASPEISRSHEPRALTRRSVVLGMLRGSILPALACLSAPAQQPVVPPQAIEQFQQVVGNRAEAAIILGGDYGAAGGIYSFRGGKVAELSVAKLGGGGDICPPRSLGLGGIEWAPVLQGNLGHFTADNDFPGGYLQGNRLVYERPGRAGRCRRAVLPQRPFQSGADDQRHLRAYRKQLQGPERPR